MQDIIIYAADYTMFVDGWFGSARGTKVFGLTRPTKEELLELAQVYSTNAVGLKPSENGKMVNDITLYQYNTNGNVINKEFFSPVYESK